MSKISRALSTFIFGALFFALCEAGVWVMLRCARGGCQTACMPLGRVAAMHCRQSAVLRGATRGQCRESGRTARGSPFVAPAPATADCSAGLSQLAHGTRSVRTPGLLLRDHHNPRWTWTLVQAHLLRDRFLATWLHAAAHSDGDERSACASIEWRSHVCAARGTARGGAGRCAVLVWQWPEGDHPIRSRCSWSCREPE